MYNIDINDPDINEKLKDKKIVVPKETSRLYQYAKNSETMEKWIVENYDRIKNGEKPLQDSIEFPTINLSNEEARGLLATIHNANTNNIKIGNDGSLTIDLDDNYDYEEWDKYKWDKQKTVKDNLLNAAIVRANNNAYEQQKINKLENFPVKLQLNYTKEELEELLRKYRRRTY